MVVFQDAGLHHFGAGAIYDLFERCGVQVKNDTAVQKVTSQFEQRVQRYGGHVRLRPSTAAFFYVLLELDPPGKKAVLMSCSLYDHPRISVLVIPSYDFI